jgi:hypothetical protein
LYNEKLAEIEVNSAIIRLEDGSLPPEILK